MGAEKKFYKKWWFWIVVGIFAFMLVVFIVGIATPTNPPVQQPKSSSSSSVPSVTGFGATLMEWNKSHVADTRFAANTAYNPDQNLPDQRYNDRYILISRSGRVLSYEMRLAGSPNIDTAKGAALNELPPDATVVWFSKKDQCAQMEVQSKTLGMVLSDSENKQGAALIEFQTMMADGKDAYSQTNNNDIFLNLGVYRSPQDAPGC